MYIYIRAVFKFNGQNLTCAAKGVNFDEFKEQFTEDDRAFGYIRLQTGDEMSKRQKFLFVTWVGPNVSVIRRAKMSTDKSLIKGIVSVNIIFYKLKIIILFKIIILEFCC